MNNAPLFGETRLDYQDNWTFYWLSYVPFEQFLEKLIHAKTRWETYWKKVRGKQQQNSFHVPVTILNKNNYMWGFSVFFLPPSLSSFPLLHLAYSSQVSIVPRQTWWFIVAIHLLYSSITGRLLGDHGSSCLLLSSTEGPSVSGGRWKALRTPLSHRIINQRRER